jgi:tetratricopeptide (TPR) repeat protein
VLAAIPVAAQSLVMSLPRQSQRATVSQRIALTDVTVTYHRPLVGGRKVWGAMVPYGQVWRAGANENTTIEFSDPVQIEGQTLAKGIYGLHMIPTADAWTIIFSKNATSWGSFSYDAKEDALRVTVKPAASEMHDALTYDFDDVKPDSALVTLRWEKLAVPFRVAADKEATFTHVSEQLRNSAQYTWQGWNDAADWCLNSKTNLEAGLKWIGNSIAMEDRFINEMTKSQLLKELNRDGESKAAYNRAIEMANPTELYSRGRQLQLSGQKAEGMEIFRQLVKRYPDHWVAHLAQARLSVAGGDFATALKEIQAAQVGAPVVNANALKNLQKRIENKEDING